MSEPVKKANPTNAESYSPKKPEILSAAEETQRKNTDVKEEFVRKNTVELITLNEDIKVVGLSFQKCRQTGSVELNSKFDLYGYGKFTEELRNNIKNIKYPDTGYAVWANTEKDMISGTGVTDFGEQDEIYAAYTIPAGRYLKVAWNAETFNELVMDAMKKTWARSGADAFIKEHRLSVDHTLDIEVYPTETMRVGCENGPDWGLTLKNQPTVTPATQYPEMYTLFTVKNEG